VLDWVIEVTFLLPRVDVTIFQKDFLNKAKIGYFRSGKAFE